MGCPAPLRGGNTKQPVNDLSMRLLSADVRALLVTSSLFEGFNIAASALIFPALVYLVHRQLLSAHKQEASHIIRDPLLPSQQPVRMSSATHVASQLKDRSVEAEVRIKKSGTCVELRLYCLTTFAPIEARFRALLTDERTGTSASYARRVRWALSIVFLWSVAVVGLHIKAFTDTTPDTAAQLASGAICLITVSGCILGSLVMLGWWVFSCTKPSLFYYSFFQLVAWLSMLGLYAGPAGVQSLALLVAATVVATASVVIEFTVAALHLGGDLEAYTYMGWGSVYAGGAGNAPRGTRRTRMERWFGLRENRTIPPFVWLALGLLPAIKHALVIAVVIPTWSKEQFVTAMSDFGETGVDIESMAVTSTGERIGESATSDFAVVLAGMGLLFAASIILKRLVELCLQVGRNPPLATENLLENTDGVQRPRPPCLGRITPSLFSRGGSLLLLFMLTRAILICRHCFTGHWQNIRTRRSAGKKRSRYGRVCKRSGCI